MIPSIACRCVGEKSAALIECVCGAATKQQTRAKATNGARYGISADTPARKGVNRGWSKSMHVHDAASRILDMLRLAVDILGTVVAGGVLRQQRLCPQRLLLRIFLFSRGEPFLGKRQGRHADLIIAPVSRREQMPTLGFLVLGAQGVVQIGDSTLSHLGIIRLDIDLRE